MAFITVITGRKGFGKTTVADALEKAPYKKGLKTRVFDDVRQISKPLLKSIRAAEKEYDHIILVMENPSATDRLAESGLVPSRCIHISLF